MSRSVLRDQLVGSGVPFGTVLIRRKGFMQNVESRIMIAIQNHATAMTDMCPNAERFVHDGATLAAFLTGVVRRHSDDGDIMQEPIAGKPLKKYPPTSIMNALCQLAVANHIANLKDLICNQVVRRD